MPEKDLVLREKMEHTGLFDFPAFYSFAHSWFINEQYGVIEEKYSERVSGNKRDLLIEWKATKKFSDYFKIEIAVKYEITDMTEVEAEIDGKTKKMNKGKVVAEIKGTLIKDHESKWESSAFSKFMREFYNKYIIPTRVFAMNKKTEDDTKKFKEELKVFLELSGRR